MSRSVGGLPGRHGALLVAVGTLAVVAAVPTRPAAAETVRARSGVATPAAPTPPRTSQPPLAAAVVLRGAAYLQAAGAGAFVGVGYRCGRPGAVSDGTLSVALTQRLPSGRTATWSGDAGPLDCDGTWHRSAVAVPAATVGGSPADPLRPLIRPGAATATARLAVYSGDETAEGATSWATPVVRPHTLLTSQMNALGASVRYDARLRPDGQIALDAVVRCDPGGWGAEADLTVSLVQAVRHARANWTTSEPGTYPVCDDTPHTLRPVLLPQPRPFHGGSAFVVGTLSGGICCATIRPAREVRVRAVAG